MAELNIFTEGTQKKILDELRLQNSLVKILASGWNINDFQTVQELVRGGGGKRYFPVGTQFAVPHSEYGGGTVIFDVVAHDLHKNPSDENAHTMTLLMHDVIYGRQVDASEMLWANTTGSELAAGTYNFTLYKGGNSGRTEEDGTYQFTTTKPIPVGGGWTHGKVGMWYASAAEYKPENIVGAHIKTFGANGEVLEENIAVSLGNGGTSLGTASNAKADCVHTIGSFNSVMRRGYGSNNWAESAIRQWLNSDATSGWWQKKTDFDLQPNYSNVAGFLNGLDKDFAAVLGAVDITTARNTIYETADTSGSYITRDKIFLPSMTELGLGNNDTVAEGGVMTLYDGATQVDRIKYDITNPSTARYWWVRSPYPWGASNVRSVYSDGALSSHHAYNGYGAAAACVIY